MLLTLLGAPFGLIVVSLVTRRSASVLKLPLYSIVTSESVIESSMCCHASCDGVGKFSAPQALANITESSTRNLSCKGSVVCWTILKVFAVSPLTTSKIPSALSVILMEFPTSKEVNEIASERVSTKSDVDTPITLSLLPVLDSI